MAGNVPLRNQRAGSSDLSDAPSESEAQGEGLSLPTPSKTSRKRKTAPLQQSGASGRSGTTTSTTPTKKRKLKTESAENISIRAVKEEFTEGAGASYAPPKKPRKGRTKAVPVEQANGTGTQEKTKEGDDVQQGSGDPVDGTAHIKQEVKIEVEKGILDKDQVDTKATITKAEKKVKTKKQPPVVKDGEASDPELTKVKRKRKTKEEKELEAMPIAARTIGSKVFVGAHVSAAGGVHNCVNNALHIGGNSFALFLKSQRKWENPALKDEHSDAFKSLCETHEYLSKSHVVPHGSYLVNLAQSDAAKAKQAYDTFLDDVQRCEILGIRLYNFHPGNTGGEPRSEAIGRIAERLNAAHRATSTVVTLLENMAASPSGNTIGGCFEDLRDVISLVDDKSRVGVCFDTCHAFAAGYDLRKPETFRATFESFDEVVGAKYLRAVHLNDSKAPFASHRDLHQNIGCGFLGLRAFHNLVNDPRFWGIPLVLETPLDMIKNEWGKEIEDKGVWAREIKMLESMVGMDAEGEEFKRLEAQLWEKGRTERAKNQEQFDRKQAETAKKASKDGQRKRRKGEESNEGSSADEVD